VCDNALVRRQQESLIAQGRCSRTTAFAAPAAPRGGFRMGVRLRLEAGSHRLQGRLIVNESDCALPRRGRAMAWHTLFKNSAAPSSPVGISLLRDRHGPPARSLSPCTTHYPRAMPGKLRAFIEFCAGR